MFEKYDSRARTFESNTLKKMTLEEYGNKQKELILSPENIAAATEYFGHTPNVETVEGRNELCEYFIFSGQAEEFAKNHQHE